jgi:hypothetical protein
MTTEEVARGVGIVNWSVPLARRVRRFTTLSHARLLAGHRKGHSTSHTHMSWAESVATRWSSWAGCMIVAGPVESPDMTTRTAMIEASGPRVKRGE